MKTISAIYDEIFSDENNFYYPNVKALRIKDWTEQEALIFIKTYFEVGSKEIFCKQNMLEKYNRAVHTVSLYALGIFLYEKMGINCKINNVIGGKDSFLYIWYMTCLYHDMGYVYENSQGRDLDGCETLDLFIKKVLEGEPYLFYKGNKENASLEELCRNYYKYIYETRGHVDHGVVGGIILYHNLIRNYKEKKQKSGSGNETKFYDEAKNVWFSKDLFPYYKLAAMLIARHNMWYASPEKSEAYKAAGLDKLILNREQRINLEKAKPEMKLLFLLCFADTIEPLKVYNQCNTQFVLEHLKLDIAKSSTGLNVGFYVDTSVLMVSVLEERIKSLEEFLDVECKTEMLSNECVRVRIVIKKSTGDEYSEYNQSFNRNACLEFLDTGEI